MGQVVFVDSCGDYHAQGTSGVARSYLQGKWDLHHSTGVWLGILSGRNGGNAIRARGTAYIERELPPSDTYCVGFALRQNAVLADDAYGIVSFAAQLAGTRFIGLAMNIDRSISLYINNAEVAKSEPVIQYSDWCYVEMKVYSNSNGHVEVRSNDQTILQYAGDTSSPLDAGIASIRFGGYMDTSDRDRQFDDIYINRLDDPEEDGFLGDVRVLPRMPNADIQTQFERAGGTTNYENINEAGAGAPDDDTYVRGEPGDKDLYGLQSIQDVAGYTPRKVHAVQATARVIAEGEVQPFRTIIKSGDVASEGPQSFADASAEPRYIGLHCVDLDPETGLPWTVSRANQIQAGFKLEGGE